jgi:hypothetical protein
MIVRNIPPCLQRLLIKLGKAPLSEEIPQLTHLLYSLHRTRGCVFVLSMIVLCAKNPNKPPVKSLFQKLCTRTNLDGGQSLSNLFGIPVEKYVAGFSSLEYTVYIIPLRQTDDTADFGFFEKVVAE